MKIFNFLFYLPAVLTLAAVTILILALAVANRHDVPIYLDPFDVVTPQTAQITFPLGLIILLSVFVGVLLGSIATWLEQGKFRRAARRAKAEGNSLRAEIARLNLPSTSSQRKLS
ncbi:MAG TPA: lipopolysaccharide assembly protein LapA domain-containing protein [Methylocella sp.]|nr:lipopolysaccharide assembly protein LapA domain-containing protein [Methylocella sp.]